MAETVKQAENVHAGNGYPQAPSGLSEKAQTLDKDVLWARIEAYISHRFTVRPVVWLVEASAGDQWTPPLGPVVSWTAERWWDEWTEVDLMQGPLGLHLPSNGTFRITAQVGIDDIPAPVAEAFRRLAEYLAGGRSTVDEPGASDFSFKMDQLEWSVQRNPAHIARAMQNSGAADLLRPYRRA
ncbi:MAG: hypothetical protein ACSHXW_02405 [Yoonia sp.]